MDKTTLKQWFSRGKKPTAAQFAAWIDSYWHHDEVLPMSAVEDLEQVLSEKAEINDLSAGAASTTYSSAKIRELLNALTGSMEPEKEVVVVETTADLETITDPSTQALYLVEEDNSLYSYDGEQFTLITDSDSTITIRNLSGLDGTTTAGSYSVRWIRATSTGRSRVLAYSSSMWSLSVEFDARNKITRQYLANRDGYYARSLQNDTWSDWEQHLYVRQEELEQVQPMISTTHAELLAMVEGGTLVAGQQYRITDFVTAVANDAEARSAGHAFDLIVVADDERTLNASARAIAHDGDTYFASADLSKWQVWYDIHNDTTRYQWADATNGKGVIYRLLDEWQNDCPYDFKNVQFKRYNLTISDDTKWQDDIFSLYGYFGVQECIPYTTCSSTDYNWHYTFHDAVTSTDGSLNAWKPASNNGYNGTCHHNVMGAYMSVLVVDEVAYPLQCLNNNTMLVRVYDDEDTYGTYCNTFGVNCYNNAISKNCYSNTFGNHCYSNTFGNDCYSNTFGNYCSSNTFGNYCYSNTFGIYCGSNTFGNECRANSFGNDCYYNAFGYNCSSNAFGNYCRYNTFGNYCYSNTFGNECRANSFGNECASNSFGNDCYYNAFGYNCSSNSFGNSCYYTTFGDNCYSNTFGNACCYTTFGTHTASVKTTKDYMRYISVESGVQYVNITCIGTTSSSACAQNAVVHSGVVGTSSTYKTCTISATNTAYLTEFGEKVQGTIS